MTRVKLSLAYDGSAYHGWQKQPRQNSIQGELESALQQLTQTVVPITGAGRTDAGVHALGQSAHFDTNMSLSPARWIRALNALLPRDIAVNRAEFVDENFHARFSALSKTYRYQILNTTEHAPLSRHHRVHIHYDLKLQKMRAAAKALSGLHCFTSFCAAGSVVPDHNIDLHHIKIQRAGNEINMTLSARKFLKYMVRNIVGFLIEVGRGKRSPDEIQEIFNALDRKAAGPRAPAHGLILVEVKY